MVLDRTSLSPARQEMQACCRIPLSRKSKFYDVNRRSVLAIRRIGRGYSGLEKFCTVMDLPKPISKSNFHSHQSALARASNVVAEKRRNSAAQELLDSEENNEISVTFWWNLAEERALVTLGLGIIVHVSRSHATHVRHTDTHRSRQHMHSVEHMLMCISSCTPHDLNELAQLLHMYKSQVNVCSEHWCR